MKNLFLILIPLLILASCTDNRNYENDIKIIELEKQVQDLSIENTKLKQDNELLQVGGIPSTVTNNSLFPEGTTFEETNSADCYKKARDNYISRGIKKCVDLGYKDADIKADKCQLDTSFINELKTQKMNEEANCGPM